jgi:hypothetical protein
MAEEAKSCFEYLFRQIYRPTCNGGVGDNGFERVLSERELRTCYLGDINLTEQARDSCNKIVTLDRP